MSKVFAIIVLLLSSLAFAQDTRPRLELQPNLNLNGGGFQAVSASVTGGTGMELNHLSWHVSGTFDEARKVNDGDQPNPHGNVRSLGADLFGRTSGGWLYGTIISYSELRTTNYTKTGTGVSVGGGKDWMHFKCPTCNSYTSFRLIAMYTLPLKCTTQSLHCTVPTVDVEQAISLRLTLPSPIETDRHLFFVANTSASWIKTSPTGSYTHDGGSSFGLLFRF